MSEPHYQHSTMGRFTRDNHGDYVQRVRVGEEHIDLILNCAYEGIEWLSINRLACVEIAASVYDKLDKLVESAAALGSSRCLEYVNGIRAEEGKSPLTPAAFVNCMRLLEVCIAPDNGVVTFGANAYEDEHSLVRVRFGPGGDLREAYIE